MSHARQGVSTALEKANKQRESHLFTKITVQRGLNRTLLWFLPLQHSKLRTFVIK